MYIIYIDPNLLLLLDNHLSIYPLSYLHVFPFSFCHPLSTISTAYWNIEIS